MAQLKMDVPIVVLECPLCGHDMYMFEWEIDDEDVLSCEECEFRDLYESWPSDVDVLRIVITKKDSDIDYRVSLYG